MQARQGKHGGKTQSTPLRIKLFVKCQDPASTHWNERPNRMSFLSSFRCFDLDWAEPQGTEFAPCETILPLYPPKAYIRLPAVASPNAKRELRPLLLTEEAAVTSRHAASEGRYRWRPATGDPGKEKNTDEYEISVEIQAPHLFLICTWPRREKNRMMG